MLGQASLSTGSGSLQKPGANSEPPSGPDEDNEDCLSFLRRAMLVMYLEHLPSMRTR